MEKATYSLSALKQCKELIRKNRWSTRLKAEHNSRCAEVNVLFASCQKLLNYVMFQPDLSPAYDYQQMVLSKSCTKKQLDNQLRVFATRSEMYAPYIALPSVDVTPDLSRASANTSAFLVFRGTSAPFVNA